jgi:hypothetical protein
VALFRKQILKRLHAMIAELRKARAEKDDDDED